MKDLSNKENFYAYYLQFATEATKLFVLSELTIEDIKEALENGDEYLNNIKIPYNNLNRGGGWWWDLAPINTKLLKEANEPNSLSIHTCVAKAVAKELVKHLL